MSARRIKIALAIAFASITLLAGVGTCSYYRGKGIGRADQKLEQLAASKKAIVQKSVVDTKAADVAKRDDKKATAAAVTARREYHEARSKVKVSGDTIEVAGQSPIVVPELASLIHTTDALVPADSIALAKKDSRIASLETLVADWQKRAAIADSTVAVLEKEKHRRFGVKTGIAVGVVGTLALLKTVAVLVVKAGK